MNTVKTQLDMPQSEAALHHYPWQASAAALPLEKVAHCVVRSMDIVRSECEDIALLISHATPRTSFQTIPIRTLPGQYSGPPAP